MNHPDGLDFARRCGLIDRPVSALLTHPTGTGKTHAAQEVTATVLAQGQVVLMVVPTRALADEVQVTWAATFPAARVRAFTSDTRAGRYAAADVVILTPERFDLLTRRGLRQRWLQRVGLLIVDELHLLNDPERGATLEGALTRLRLARPTLRVLALTATCGNPQGVARWLGALHFGGGARPTPLTWDAVRVQGARRVAALTRRLRPGEPTLVFVHARARAEELAQALTQAGRSARPHHAGLARAERLATEAAFRAGETDTLVCTPTLELGVNLPAAHVVLYDTALPDGGTWRPLSVNAAHQRAGRAGRPGAARAHVTVFGDDPGRYARAPFEPLGGALRDARHLLRFLLGSVDGGFVRTEAQAARLVARTLTGTQGTLDAAAAVRALIESGGVDVVGGQLRVTPAGRVASRALLDVEAVRAVQALPDDPCALDVLLLAAAHVPVPGAAPDVAQVCGAVPSRWLDAGTPVPPGARVGAALLWLATQHGDAGAARRAGLYEDQVRRVRDDALRLVQAWTQLVDVPKVRLVQVMLGAQVPLDAATLAMLPGVGGQLARTLAGAGLGDIETLAQADVTTVVPGVRPARLAGWVAAAQRLVATFDVDPCREGAVSPARRAGESLPDAGRLARTAHLRVERRGPDFLVTGGAAPHVVTAAWACDCPDAAVTAQCKHVLAAQRWAWTTGQQ